MKTRTPSGPRSSPPALPAEGFLTVENVAEMLQVTQHTVYRWIYAGRLRRAAGLRCVRIHPADLQAMLSPGPEQESRPRPAKSNAGRKGRKVQKFSAFPL